MTRHPLTDEQKRVVASEGTLIFVESVPGSGKTTVAVERFGVLRHARLVADPRAVVAVSFARSAVAELRGRIYDRWGVRTAARPNNVCTMDALHRSVVELLLRTKRILWPGGNIVRPRLIDSWARQRGATRISVWGPRNQRWEFDLRGNSLTFAYRAVDSPCWGMDYPRKSDWVGSLLEGVCTHDEIRQVVGLALGRPDLRAAVGDYLSRSIAHLIVDEAFDLNGLDTVIVRCAIERGVSVTLVGDPWQALYEWRGARPDMVHQLLNDHAFETLPLHRSFRFTEPGTRDLAARLRAGEGVTLAPSTDRADVVLATEWEHLQAGGSDVVPLSFGQFDCQTDASIALLLDEVTRARLGLSTLNVTEALRCLRRDDDRPDLAPVLTKLRDRSIPVSAVMAELRNATKVEGRRQPSLPADRVDSRLARLTRLRDWLTVDRQYVAGLSVHQAKGREWPRVDVVLDTAGRKALASGLDSGREDHRKLYVALTRASYSTEVRPI